MIELNEEEMKFARNAQEIEIKNEPFITKEQLFSILNESEQLEADILLRHELGFSELRTTDLIHLQFIISCLEEFSQITKLRTFISTLQKINRKIIRYIRMYDPTVKSETIQKILKPYK